MFSFLMKKRVPENIAWRSDEATELVVNSFNEGIIKAGERVLDIGSGFGRNANWLAAKGVIVMAININSQEIEEAKEKAEKMGVNVTYLKADAIDLPFPDGSFDVAIDGGCTHMIEKKESQSRAEAEIARVLKSGGRLIYFGFSKKHPDYVNKPSSPKFRDLEDIQAMYGDDFEVLSCRENRWRPNKEEGRKFFEHVGLDIVMKRV